MSDKWMFGYMFVYCGEGTCGGFGEVDSLEEAQAEIKFWIADGAYDCYILNPDGDTVFEHKGERR